MKGVVRSFPFNVIINFIAVVSIIGWLSVNAHHWIWPVLSVDKLLCIRLEEGLDAPPTTCAADRWLYSWNDVPQTHKSVPWTSRKKTTSRLGRGTIKTPRNMCKSSIVLRGWRGWMEEKEEEKRDMCTERKGKENRRDVTASVIWGLCQAD